MNTSKCVAGEALISQHFNFVTSFPSVDNNHLTGSIRSEVTSLLDMTTLKLGEFLSEFQSIRRMIVPGIKRTFICLTMGV
jgi:hypothetical protein